MHADNILSRRVYEAIPINDSKVDAAVNNFEMMQPWK
jgi:hypothetical protein